MMESILAGLFGLIVGSFLNVCIYRWPRNLSILRPSRSFCPHCEKTIAWYDNIPLLSFALLNGRCRACGGIIAWRYPLVEFLTGSLFFLFVLAQGPTLAAAKACLFGALLVGMVFADLEERILPDEFTLGGMLAGLLLAIWIPMPDVTSHALAFLAGLQASERALSVAESAIGALLPAGFLWFGGWAYEKIRHREGLGLGDVKMLAMIGAFLGLRYALMTLIAGSVLGSVIGLGYIMITRKNAATYELPFGTFLGAAALLVAVFGAQFTGF